MPLLAVSACGASNPLPLWKITDPTGNDSALHILAAVALPENEPLRFDPAVLAAFEDSERLVLPSSASLTKQNALIGWKAHLAQGDNLAQWLTPALFSAYVEAVVSAGFPPSHADVTAPWFASTQVRVADLKRTGFAPEREFEIYFAHLARERGEAKTILPLEESATSYDRAAALSREIQSQMMQRAVFDAQRAEADLAGAARAWRQGDAGDLDTLLRATDRAHPELRESRRLTTERENARLADALTSLLSEPGTHQDFLVADARNLLGQGGVLALLRERGLQVNPVSRQGGHAAPYPAPPLQQAGEARQPGRVLLVGIDGATLRIIRPLLEAGRLPHLAAIARAGTSGSLRSHQPIYSPRIWNSIATGKSPAQHGIEGFTFQDAAGQQRLYLSSHRKAHALWNIVSAAGKKVAVVNWWNTYPPEVVNGVMISDHAKPARLAELRNLTGAEPLDEGASVFPADWQRRAVEIFTRRVGLPGLEDPFLGNLGLSEWMKKEELSKRFRDDAATARIALEVEAEQHPDLMMVFLPGIDRVSHRLWGAVEAPERYTQPLDMSAQQRDAARQALHAYYSYSDALIGLLSTSYGENDLVMVVSDHGFEAGSHLGDLTGVHASEAALDGILFARGNGISPGSDPGPVSVNDITPTVLAWLGLPIGEDMDGRSASFLRPAQPVGTIATHDTSAIERLGVAPSGKEEEILDQLRALGYID
jgi:uncharacterized protein YbaP (TraB family)